LFAEAADRLDSPLNIGSGFGLATSFQVVPFQCSANVCEKPFMSVVKPTAQILFAVSAAALAKTFCAELGFALEIILH